ncbi:SPX domain-containing protein [Parasitella parasitica]|nr:SPX domain-containing protein [Parasitella parasitica]
MKFGKQLETEAEGIPSEWRPYLIQYKTLKKLITKVAEEIESRGLSTSLLHECLDEDGRVSSAVKDEEDEGIPKIKYYFTGEPPNVKPNIEFIYDSEEPKVQKALSRLLSSSATAAAASDYLERPKLEFKRSQNNKDFFSLSTDAAATKGDTTLEDQDEHILVKAPTVKRQRRSSTVTLVKELLILTLEEKDRIKDRESSERLDSEENREKHEKHIKTLVVELEQDDEFFKFLMEELQQANMLQNFTSQKFQHNISDLEMRMTKVAAPTQKTDMYNWRKIFSIYMDAQIFQGNAESDRTFRSVERAKKQMAWFIEQLGKTRLLNKLKSKESKSAFEQFVALNTELITMKHYQMLNQTAMRKILKKHDKRSGLTASQSFLEIVSTDALFSPKLANMLYATITSKVTTIIPQPEDYGNICGACEEYI